MTWAIVRNFHINIECGWILEDNQLKERRITLPSLPTFLMYYPDHEGKGCVTCTGNECSFPFPILTRFTFATRSV